METIVLYPNRKYNVKLFIGSVPPGLIIAVIIILRVGQADPLLTGTCLALFASYVVAVGLFTRAYCNTISYEITDTEVVVYMGLITKTVKHVPFRNITNLQITRGPLDRLLVLGSLDIQTAGSSSVLPEEKLVGLGNVQEVYEYLANVLRQFRSAMPPTQAETGLPPSQSSTYDQQLLTAILEELRAIRAELSQRGTR